MEQSGSDTKCIRVRISGRVQGVCFRRWTTEQAHALDLRGWVRNRLDGTVEAVFAGLTQSVDMMLCACHEGPRDARVTEVQHSLEDNDPGVIGFEEWPTC